MINHYKIKYVPLEEKNLSLVTKDDSEMKRRQTTNVNIYQIKKVIIVFSEVRMLLFLEGFAYVI
jgi:hypothetical protein